MDMKNKGLFTSKTDDWATPQKFFDDLNKVYNFQLDVCASHSNHKCACYYTVEDDGLKSYWRNNVSINRWVWMNPPYGREIGKWVKKAAESGLRVVALLPARTDTKWFHEYIYRSAEVQFIKGRLKFGDAKNSAPFPSMLVIWRSRGE